MLPAHIPSPSRGVVHLGPVPIRAYALCIILGVIVATVVGQRRFAKRGGRKAAIADVATWAVPFGLVGARLYHLATNPELYWGGPGRPGTIGALKIWDGGLGIWGGILGGALVGIWRVHRAGVSVPAFMDCVAPALLVAQAIGRVGNYFNQELFGGPTSLPWGLEISPEHRPEGYLHYATFQPTFLYEIIWNLALAAFLVWLGHHRKIKPPGLFALYVAGYSAFRIFEESLRVDPAHHILGQRLNFWVAIVLTLVGLAWFAWTQRAEARDPMPPVDRPPPGAAPETVTTS